MELEMMATTKPNQTNQTTVASYYHFRLNL